MKSISGTSRSKSKTLSLTGLMAAMTLILVYTPIGVIQLPFISATIAHIPTIVIAILEGPAIGFGMGCLLGIALMVRAFVMPTGVLDYYFRNPVLSVLPRALIGVAAYFVFRWLFELIKNKNSASKNTVPVILATAVGSMTNTIGVMALLYIIYGRAILEIVRELMGVSVEYFIVLTIATSGIAEMVVTAFLATAIIKALQKVIYRT